MAAGLAGSAGEDHAFGCHWLLVPSLDEWLRRRVNRGSAVDSVFTAGFADEAAYDIEDQGILDDPSQRIRARWRDPLSTDPPLVPVGLEQLLQH